MKNLLTILLVFNFYYLLAQVPGPLIKDVIEEYKIDNKATLLGLWKFESGNGKIAYDISGNNNHGSIYNPLWKTDLEGSVKRNCLMFNGNSFVQTDLSLNKLPYTIMAKFKSTKNKDEQSIVDSDIGGRYGNSIILGYTNGDNTIDVQYHNGFYNSPKVYLADKWYTVVATYQKDSVSLYVNGDFIGSKIYKQSIPDGSNLRIGRHNKTDPQWFYGLIDEVAVWEGVVSAREIQNIKYPKKAKKILNDLHKLKKLESRFQGSNYEENNNRNIKTEDYIFNQSYKPQPYKLTEFTKLAHAFGYYCRFEDKEKVYKYIKETDKIIEQPFFFIGDQCLALRPYIFEYFSLLRIYNHQVDEQIFNYVINNYFFNPYYFAGTEINTTNIDFTVLDIVGKSILMYASEFGYINTVKEIIKFSDINQLSTKNQTALTFACINNNIEMIKLLKKNGAKTKITDSFNKIPSDYCSSKKAKKAAR